jgi:serine protease
MKCICLRGFVVIALLFGLGLLKPVPLLALESRFSPDQAPAQFLPAPDATQGSKGAGSASSGRDERTDRLIVKYRDQPLARPKSLGSAALQTMSSRAGVALSHLRAMSGGRQVFKMPGRMSHGAAKAIAAKLSADPEVEYAVPDRIMFPTVSPNDTSLGSQWDLQSPAFEIAGSNLPAAWDITTGSGAVVVGVIDTGIVNHADLQGRILPGYNFISDPTMAGNGIGRSADASDLGDWDFEGSFPSPSSWHGSHVAGTIAATTDNGAGVSGINWNSKILPVRVLGHGGGYWSDIADGMRWAAGLPVPGAPINPNPARVLNMSLGGALACDAGLQNDIDDLVSAGVVVVAAAGNLSTDVAGFSPAGCNGVIAVAALGRSGGKAVYSNFGQLVKIAAPGDMILSTLNTGLHAPVPSPAGDTYRPYSGTSMAAPHVAGVVSLLLSLNPALTPTQVLAILQASARPFPTGTSTGDCTTSRCGAGILDAYQAVLALAANQPMVATSPSGLLFNKNQGEPSIPSQSLTINVLHGNGLNWSASSNAAWLRVTPATGQQSATLSVSVDASGLAAGVYNATITVHVAGATNSPLTVPVTLLFKQMLSLQAPSPTAVSNPALAAVADKLYLIGGIPAGSLVQIYDTTTKAWSVGAPKPTAVSATNAAVINGKIYVPGGFDGLNVSNVLEIYDPATNQWSSGPPLPAALQGAGVQAMNGKLFVMGGQDLSRSFRANYGYDPATQTWSNLANFIWVGRSWFGSAVANGKIYTFGGWDGGTGLVSSGVQAYDPVTNVWTDVKPMNRSRIWFASTVLAGKIYALGGRGGIYAPDKLQDAEIYDPATNTWSDTPLLLNQGRDEVKSVAIGSTFYLLGGNHLDMAGGTTQSVVSSLNESYTLIQPVNGVCGSSSGLVFPAAPTVNLCSGGTPGPLTGSGPWNWSCLGLNMGTTANCSAGLANPLVLIGNAAQNAFLGYFFDMIPSVTGGQPPYSFALGDPVLPSGLSYDYRLGRLSGFASPAGAYHFSLYVTDAVGTVTGKYFTLTVKPFLPAMIFRNPSQYYTLVQDAYKYCADGETIKLSGSFPFQENLLINRNVKVVLDGGYDDNYTASSGTTRITGKLSVSNGKLKLNGVTFR